MLGRLVCLLTGVYSGVVVDQTLRKHKVLETWAPGEAWDKAKVRFKERIKLWKSEHRPAGFWSESFKSGNDNADEDLKTFAETLRSEKGHTSAGGQGLEEQVGAGKDGDHGAKESFQEKIKVWTVRDPETQGIMEEKMKLIKERVPVIQGMVEEKVRVLKEEFPDIKEKLHDKMNHLKDKSPEVTEVLKEKMRTVKEKVVAGGEVIGEKVKVIKETSSRVKEMVEETVRTLEENVTKGREINDEGKLKESIDEVERVAQEAEIVFRDQLREFGEREGQLSDFKSGSSELKDVLETEGNVFEDKSPELKEVTDENAVSVSNYPALKEILKEKEEVLTYPDMKNIDMSSSENNDVLKESGKCFQDNCSQLKEKEDKNENFHEKLTGNEREFKDTVNDSSEPLPEKNQVVMETPLNAESNTDDEKPNFEGKTLAEKKDVVEEGQNEVPNTLHEKMQTLKRSAPEVSEILKGKMNSLKDTAPEVTEMLKGKINALKRKFRREESETRTRNVEVKKESAEGPKDEPKSQTHVKTKIAPSES